MSELEVLVRKSSVFSTTVAVFSRDARKELVFVKTLLNGTLCRELANAQRILAFVGTREGRTASRKASVWKGLIVMPKTTHNPIVKSQNRRILTVPSKRANVTRDLLVDTKNLASVLVKSSGLAEHNIAPSPDNVREMWTVLGGRIVYQKPGLFLEFAHEEKLKIR